MPVVEAFDRLPLSLSSSFVCISNMKGFLFYMLSFSKRIRKIEFLFLLLLGPKNHRLSLTKKDQVDRHSSFDDESILSDF